MKFAALLPLFCLLVSCEINQYEAISARGNIVRESNWQLGGTRSARRADGSSYANDHQQSFRDGAAAVGLAIGAYQAVKINGSNNTATTTQQANTLKATTAQQKIAADQAIELAKLPK